MSFPQRCRNGLKIYFSCRYKGEIKRLDKCNTCNEGNERAVKEGQAWILFKMPAHKLEPVSLANVL